VRNQFNRPRPSHKECINFDELFSCDVHVEHHIMILIQYPGTGFAQTKTFTTDLNHRLPDNSGDVGIE
jgi:hypothetical protein